MAIVIAPVKTGKVLSHIVLVLNGKDRIRTYEE